LSRFDWGFSLEFSHPRRTGHIRDRALRSALSLLIDFGSFKLFVLDPPAPRIGVMDVSSAQHEKRHTAGNACRGCGMAPPHLLIATIA
jgi:hypothetical protein